MGHRPRGREETVKLPPEPPEQRRRILPSATQTLHVLVELGVFYPFSFQPFVERVLVQLKVGLEEVPVLERVLGALHVPFRRVPNKGLGVVPEVFPEDIQEPVRPAVGDRLCVL